MGEAGETETKVPRGVKCHTVGASTSAPCGMDSTQGSRVAGVFYFLFSKIVLLCSRHISERLIYYYIIM